MRLALVGLVAAGCGAGGDNTGVSGADANGGTCQVFITFDPDSAHALPGPGQVARAIAHVSNLNGLPTYDWHVVRAETGDLLPFTNAQADGSQIEFPTIASGAYNVSVALGGTGASCPTDSEQLNVGSGQGDSAYRLRVRSSTAPPQELDIVIPRDTPTYAFGGFVLSRGKPIAVTLTHGSTRVPAYVRLAPTSYPDEIVEAFSDASGVFHATVVDHQQTMLVIPALPGIAPQTITTDFSGTQTFDLATGTTLTGTVTDPAGAGLANAHVQLAIDDVPSTLTTTASDGSFSVQAVLAAGATISIAVTPPAASGLPRLAASGAFDPTKPFAVAYGTNLAPRDLAGARITRGAGSIANAQVTLVGTISDAGSVTSGGTRITATGAIHASATANGAGVLPMLKTSPLGMAAVVQTAPGDVAIVPLDLTPTTALPSTIEAPAPSVATSLVLDGHGMPLAGVTVDVTPVGALALAGAQPTRAMSGAAGALSFALASGGQYELRLQDAQSRVAPLVASVAPTVPATLVMPAATIVTGDLSTTGLGFTAGALVQVLCKSCGGVDRTRPLAEVTTDASGHYHYAVADPGPP